MLDHRGHDVIALVPERIGDALQGVVVGLAAAAGEDDLVALACEQAGDLVPAKLDSLARRPTGPMPARRIAIRRFKEAVSS